MKVMVIEIDVYKRQAYAYHANVLNYEDAEVNRFFCEALFKIGYEESADALLPTVLKVGEINLKCMALLDLSLIHI